MEDKSKKILVFTTAYRPLVGGSEIALEQVIRRLPDVFFHIVTPRLDKKSKSVEMGDNYCIYRLGYGGKISKLLFPLSGYFKGVNLIRKNNIKLAHAYQASFGAGAAWLLKLFQKKLTFALTLQEGKDFSKQSRIINFFRKLIIRKADAITAISDYLAKYAKSFNKKAKVIVIPNGVDFNLFKTVKDDEKIPESLGIKKDERILITTSRLVPKNGLMDLIEAMGILKKEIPQIKLLIIGSGSLLGKMKKKSELLGLKNDILFLGEIENSKLPEYLRTADIFVRPSLSEGLGNSFLEAMAVGVPIIGTPVGGIIDFLIDGKTGIFCRPHDPRSIADAVMKILSDKQLNELLIKNGQELIGEKYDWQIIAGKFNDFYHDLGIY